ncbi:hypothetical protein GKD43_19160 [Odoribacter splanchnicus]|nr:hypothetical protein [Odoribacter splanchnicus]
MYPSFSRQYFHRSRHFSHHCPEHPRSTRHCNHRFRPATLQILALFVTQRFVCQIAELQFFNPDSLSPLPGRAIGTPGTLNNAFDGDPLTFYEYHEADGGWIGLDFGKPTRIDRIAFQPRNDDNYVVAGDEYELFYRSSTAWESLGKQKPSHPWVEYPAVPSNALLLLKNHSRGQEERIFTWEKQKQKWW